MSQTINDDKLNRRNKRRRALLAILLGSSIATLGAGTLSLATFTDASSNGGTWTTGTIVLGVSPTTVFSPTNILPGDSGSQTIAVANNGTGALRYAMTGSTTNADLKGLADQLTLTVQAGACTAPGATLYSGALSAAALGSAASGAQAGDRNVAAGATDQLCFSWAFPLASGNGFQNAATSATFSFAAEQTANNP